RLVVDGPEDALAPYAVVRARPSELTMLRLEEVDAVRIVSADDQQASCRVEARRPVVRAAALVRGDQPAVTCRLLAGVRNGPDVRVDAFGPYHRGERRGQEALACRSVQNEVVSIARGLDQQFPRRPRDGAIHQYRDLGCVPVMGIVRRRLKAPRELARVR